MSDNIMSFFTLLGSLISIIFGGAVLLRSLLLKMFTIAGWAGVGGMLITFGIGLFVGHIWLDKQVPDWKKRYGR